MNWRLLLLCLGSSLGLFPALASASGPVCEGLSEAQQQVAARALQSVHPYDCCDRTLASCLEEQPRCALVDRLVAEVCRLAKNGRDRSEIERAMTNRARTMLPSLASPAIALEEGARAGEEKAPVTLVVYACTRCRFCKALLPELHRAVTEGPLRGKARLYLRPFPLRDHEGSTEGGLALLAASESGRLWPFLLETYAHFDAFALEDVLARLEKVGLSRDEAQRRLNDAALRERLLESKKEGVRNKVASTPTLFLNGRRYHYELDLEGIVSVVLEEHERLIAGGKPAAP